MMKSCICLVPLSSNKLASEVVRDTFRASETLLWFDFCIREVAMVRLLRQIGGYYGYNCYHRD